MKGIISKLNKNEKGFVLKLGNMHYSGQGEFLEFGVKDKNAKDRLEKLKLIENYPQEKNKYCLTEYGLEIYGILNKNKRQ